jgi:hypothetical protein
MRKQSWLLVPAALLLAAGEAAAAWTHLGTSEGGAEIYVDRATFRKSGNTVSLWMMEDYKSPRTFSGKTFLSARLQHDYDCKDRKRRTLQSSLYSANKGNGTVVLSSTKASDWRPIAAASVAETLWKMACGKK